MRRKQSGAAVVEFALALPMLHTAHRLAVRRSDAAHVTLTAVGPVREPEPVVPLRVEGGETQIRPLNM